MCVYRAYYFSTESSLVRTSLFLSQASLHPFSLTRLTHAHMMHFICDIHILRLSYAHAHITHFICNAHAYITATHTQILKLTHQITHTTTRTNSQKPTHTPPTYTRIHLYIYIYIRRKYQNTIYLLK